MANLRISYSDPIQFSQVPLLCEFFLRRDLEIGRTEGVVGGGDWPGNWLLDLQYLANLETSWRQSLLKSRQRS